jgi:hypothetical protein
MWTDFHNKNVLKSFVTYVTIRSFSFIINENKVKSRLKQSLIGVEIMVASFKFKIVQWDKREDYHNDLNWYSFYVLVNFDCFFHIRSERAIKSHAT